MVEVMVKTKQQTLTASRKEKRRSAKGVPSYLLTMHGDRRVVVLGDGALVNMHVGLLSDQMGSTYMVYRKPVDRTNHPVWVMAKAKATAKKRAVGAK